MKLTRLSFPALALVALVPMQVAAAAPPDIAQKAGKRAAQCDIGFAVVKALSGRRERSLELDRMTRCIIREGEADVRGVINDSARGPKLSAGTRSPEDSQQQALRRVMDDLIGPSP
jgi:hypothetical protein